MAAWRIVLVAVVLAAPGLAACGGDDEPASPKEAFLDAGNDICDDLGFELPEPKSPGEVIAGLRRATNERKQAIEKLRDLTPPPGDKDEVDELLDAAEKEIALSTAYLDLSEAGKESDELEAELEKVAEEAARLTKAYGLEECVDD